ncbi:MAG: hypothetical protein CK532_06405 [Flavobacteriales bacterium]|nr:MAG: hypothetical protein CK532_06405 [Flavobacteriales bacterium]
MYPLKTYCKSQIGIHFLVGMFVFFVFFQTANAQSNLLKSDEITGNSINHKQNIDKKASTRYINGKIFSIDSLKTKPDSFQHALFLRGLYFYDSLKAGLLDYKTQSIAGPNCGDTIVYNFKDPFDPFNNKIFYRKGQGKFWFFGMCLIMFVVFVFYRNVYSKQFLLRWKSVYNLYFFNELIAYNTLTIFNPGSVIVLILSQAVFALGIMLYFICKDFLNLNNLGVFTLLYLLLLLLVIGLQCIQYLFTTSLGLEVLLRRQLQRQLNINFILALVCFPLFLLAYYNGYKIQGVALSDCVSFILVFWIVLRSAIVFIGMFQDRQLNPLAFLYFCTFEIVPYAIFFIIISRI